MESGSIPGTVSAVPENARHSRQVRFAPIGEPGQARLAKASVAIMGCGALGAAVIEQLARAGIGRLRLIDRDFVDDSNLQRQSLYTEEDATQALPKAVAAAAHVRALASAVVTEPIVADISARTVLDLIDGCDLVIDGTDNFQTRHLINEACCQRGVPWIYGACVGAYGLSAPIIPGATGCLRCLQDQLPAPGDVPTCDTAGVIAPIVHVVAGWQAAEALKFLTGNPMRRELWATDVWHGTFQRLAVTRDPHCVACGLKPTYPLLSERAETPVVLCGRDAVQMRLPATPDLDALARRLGPSLRVANPYLVRWHDGDWHGTCFRDGRVIVHGSSDASRARAFCDRWLG